MQHEWRLTNAALSSPIQLQGATWQRESLFRSFYHTCWGQIHQPLRNVGNRCSGLRTQIRASSAEPLTQERKKPDRTQRARKRAVAEPSTAHDDIAALSTFLRWAKDNGAQGVDPTPRHRKRSLAPPRLSPEKRDKLVLMVFRGERTIVAAEGLRKGEVALKVPGSLAFVDNPPKGGEPAGDKAAPWLVRMAIRLLRHRARGSESDFYSYIQVLPKTVPGPLQSFSPEDLAGIEDPSLREYARKYHEMADIMYRRVRPEVLHGASKEDFRWAMAVVMSRSFTGPEEWQSSEGGGGSIMMPLADMLQHGGEQAARLLYDECQLAANTTWRFVNPRSRQWAMEIVALRDIEPGEQLMCSYGDRTNDNFFVHYGFVPQRNPHDTVVLFDGVPQALEWYITAFPQLFRGKSTGTLRQLREAASVRARADEATLRQMQNARSLPEPLGEHTFRQTRKLQLRAREPGAVYFSPGDTTKLPWESQAAWAEQAFGCWLSRLLEPGAQVASFAVLRRVQEVLAGRAPLLGDLRVLAGKEAGLEAEEREYYRDIHEYYSKKIRQYTSRYEPPPNLGTWDNAVFATGATQGLEAPLTPQKLLDLKHRVVKKMACWDTLIVIRPQMVLVMPHEMH